MATRKTLGGIFARHMIRDFWWVDPRKIVLAQWVGMKYTS